MLDLKIAGGTVLDGTGGPEVRADIGVTDGRIVATDLPPNAPARIVLDAGGLVVCPGFIDAHTHSDAFLLIEPSAPSKTFQGVTTEVTGNCGASAAPVAGGYRLPSDWRDKQYPGRWATVAEYRRLLEQARPAPNAVLLVGHGNLRGAVVGYGAQAASPEQVRAMVRMLEQAMDEGARGLSTGLIYPPGMFAPREELAELARVPARRGGIYTSHMRSEGAHLLDAIAEALALGMETGVRIQISHLKTAGQANWPLLDQALDAIRSARASGRDVAADRYPYTASSTELDVVFPAWAHEGGRDATLARLRDPGERARLRAGILQAWAGREWDTVIIGSTSAPQNAVFRGARLTDAAAQLGLKPVDAVLHFAESDGLRTGAFFCSMSEENMLRILAEPYVMLGSDASLRAPTGPLSEDFPHPRAYGAFARFLRMALDGRTVPLPEAIRKMTSLPAAQFGLRDRGVLRPGMAADIVAFDPVRLRETATFARPHALAEGMRHVVVNGVPTVRDGALTGLRAGRVL